jgi:hypothetical protein
LKAFFSEGKKCANPKFDFFSNWNIASFYVDLSPGTSSGGRLREMAKVLFHPIFAPRGGLSL